ncbi:hypothetical protein BDW62DRAFT_161956 [Aspergillus aurantiobrunneus]
MRCGRSGTGTGADDAVGFPPVPRSDGGVRLVSLCPHLLSSSFCPSAMTSLKRMVSRTKRDLILPLGGFAGKGTINDSVISLRSLAASIQGGAVRY